MVTGTINASVDDGLDEETNAVVEALEAKEWVYSSDSIEHIDGDGYKWYHNNYISKNQINSARDDDDVEVGGVNRTDDGIFIYLQYNGDVEKDAVNPLEELEDMDWNVCREDYTIRHQSANTYEIVTDDFVGISDMQMLSDDDRWEFGSADYMDDEIEVHLEWVGDDF